MGTTIKHMHDRIAMLENALAMTWTGEGSHPLLRRSEGPNYLAGPSQSAAASTTIRGPTAIPGIVVHPGPGSTAGSKETSPDPPEGGAEEEDDVSDLTKELGTLRLDSKGNVIYMGRSAKIEVRHPSIS
jgi:hypothetical protein